MKTNCFVVGGVVLVSPALAVLYFEATLTSPVPVCKLDHHGPEESKEYPPLSITLQESVPASTPSGVCEVWGLGRVYGSKIVQATKLDVAESLDTFLGTLVFGEVLSVLVALFIAGADERVLSPASVIARSTRPHMS